MLDCRRPLVSGSFGVQGQQSITPTECRAKKNERFRARRFALSRPKKRQVHPSGNVQRAVPDCRRARPQDALPPPVTVSPRNGRGKAAVRPTPPAPSAPSRRARALDPVTIEGIETRLGKVRRVTIPIVAVIIIAALVFGIWVLRR